MIFAMNSFVFSNSSGCSLSTPNAYCSLVRSISITRTFAFSSAFASVSLEAASLDASSEEAFSEETSSEEASSEDTFSVSFSVAASVFFSVAASVFFSVAASVFFSVAASVAFVEAAVVVFLSLLFEPHPASITAAAIETAVIDANIFLIIYSPLFGCLSLITIPPSRNCTQ